MNIDWHYPRQDLAEKIVISFDQSVSDALILFAPRKMGKTEFVLLDLIPEAARRGYTPVYVCLKGKQSNPASSFVCAVRQALGEPNWWQQATKKVARARLTVHAGAAGEMCGTPDFRKHVSDTSGQYSLRTMREALSDLVAKYDRILLCLDDVQHLATRSELENMVFFLRTFLDQNRDQVSVLYTGSSRDGLAKLFTNRKAALFQSASQIDLPQLGSGFVEHMRQCYRRATTQDFPLPDGLGAFISFNYGPGAFRSVLETMILSGSNDITSAAAIAREERVEDRDYSNIWSTLKNIDQALLIWIAGGGVGLYREPCKEFIAGRLGIDPGDIETHHVQNAVNRLRGKHLSLVSHGFYEFDDARFRSWIQAMSNAQQTTHN